MAVGLIKPHVGLIFFVVENLFAINVFFHKFCYTKYTISPAGKPDKNHNDKENKNRYLIGEAIEKFNCRIIRNKEAFHLYNILGYLKELCDDYGTKPALTHTFSLKMKTIKEV